METLFLPEKAFRIVINNYKKYLSKEVLCDDENSTIYCIPLLTTHSDLTVGERGCFALNCNECALSKTNFHIALKDDTIIQGYNQEW